MGSSGPQNSLLFMDTVLHWSGWACFLVGAPTNTLLLWLIHYRTSKEMRPYARILTQTALIDLAFAAVIFAFNQVSISSEETTLIYGIGVATGDGTASVAARRWNYGLLLCWLASAAMATCAIPAQFYYRYAVVSGMGTEYG
jgi:Serpentine type 7TM GPCR chemoreceptor Srd